MSRLRVKKKKQKWFTWRAGEYTRCISKIQYELTSIHFFFFIYLFMYLTMTETNRKEIYELRQNKCQTIDSFFFVVCFKVFRFCYWKSIKPISMRHIDMQFPKLSKKYWLTKFCYIVLTLSRHSPVTITFHNFNQQFFLEKFPSIQVACIYWRENYFSEKFLSFWGRTYKS